MNYAKIFKELKYSLDINSDEELAERVDIPRYKISRLRNGHANLSSPDFRDLLNKLGPELKDKIIEIFMEEKNEIR